MKDDFSSLEEWMRRGRFDMLTLLKFAVDLLEAVAEARARGRIVSEMKISEVFWSQLQRRVRFADTARTASQSHASEDMRAAGGLLRRIVFSQSFGNAVDPGGPLSNHLPGFPRVLSDILDLLREDGYDDLATARADLLGCLNQMEVFKTISDFSPGGKGR